MRVPSKARRFCLAISLVACLIPFVAVADPSPPSEAEKISRLILSKAHSEAAAWVRYHEEYVTLAYPGGDVPAATGVCTDLIIRACRAAGLDLQKALHEDRVAHPEAYPTSLWDYKKPDASIDHRRCQNLVVWFQRFTKSLTTKLDADSIKKEWRAGDFVFFIRKGASHPWHVAIVSDRVDPDGIPRIVDGYPPFTSESHRLDTFLPIHSHFRVTEIPPRRRTASDSGTSPAPR